jgi:hypothetical protein
MPWSMNESCYDRSDAVGELARVLPITKTFDRSCQFSYVYVYMYDASLRFHVFLSYDMIMCKFSR